MDYASFDAGWGTSCTDPKLSSLLLSHTMPSSSVIGARRIPWCTLFMLASWLVGCFGNYGNSIPQLKRPGLARLIVSKWSVSAKLAVVLAWSMACLRGFLFSFSLIFTDVSCSNHRSRSGLLVLNSICFSPESIDSSSYLTYMHIDHLDL